MRDAREQFLCPNPEEVLMSEEWTRKLKRFFKMAPKLGYETPECGKHANVFQTAQEAPLTKDPRYRGKADKETRYAGKYNVDHTLHRAISTYR